MAENQRFKDCCIKKHVRFRGASLLVYSVVFYNFYTDLYVILNGDLTGVYYPDEIFKAFLPIELRVLQGYNCKYGNLLKSER